MLTKHLPRRRDSFVVTPHQHISAPTSSHLTASLRTPHPIPFRHEAHHPTPPLHSPPSPALTLHLRTHARTHPQNALSWTPTYAEPLEKEPSPCIPERGKTLPAHPPGPRYWSCRSRAELSGPCRLGSGSGGRGGNIVEVCGNALYGFGAGCEWLG
jgi:hypothetical protein